MRKYTKEVVKSTFALRKQLVHGRYQATGLTGETELFQLRCTTAIVLEEGIQVKPMDKKKHMQQRVALK